MKGAIALFLIVFIVPMLMGLLTESSPRPAAENYHLLRLQQEEWREHQREQDRQALHEALAHLQSE